MNIVSQTERMTGASSKTKIVSAAAIRSTNDTHSIAVILSCVKLIDMS